MDVTAPPAAGVAHLRALAVGMITAVMLLVATVGVAALEVTRMQQQTLALAARNHHSTYYLGTVGGQLALMRGFAALGSGGSPTELQELELRSLAADEALERAIQVAPTMLDDEGREKWAEVVPEVRQLRRVFDRARTLRSTGDSEQADALLRAELAEETSVHDALEKLERHQRDHTMEALAAAGRSTFRVRLLEAVLGGTLLAGTVFIWLLVLRALRRQRRQIAEHMARIEALNQDLDAFAGRVAHDVRNALSPVISSAALLRESGADPGSVAKICARIERSTRRAVALVDGLLAFSRAARSVTEDGETASVKEAVDDAVEQLQPLRSSLEAAVEVDVKDDCRVRAKQGLLSVVLTNLCSNAVKFLEGCPERRVRVASRVEGQWCVIEVEDSGPGIPEAVHGRIFEPFFRVPGARPSGSGIGLATVARIVDRCGGRIHVRSAPGEGACFEVRLPRAR